MADWEYHCFYEDSRLPKFLIKVSDNPIDNFSDHYEENSRSQNIEKSISLDDVCWVENGPLQREESWKEQPETEKSIEKLIEPCRIFRVQPFLFNQKENN